MWQHLKETRLTSVAQKMSCELLFWFNYKVLLVIKLKMTFYYNTTIKDYMVISLFK